MREKRRGKTGEWVLRWLPEALKCARAHLGQHEEEREVMMISLGSFTLLPGVTHELVPLPAATLLCKQPDEAPDPSHCAQCSWPGGGKKGLLLPSGASAGHS